jgi:hypothetical protein
MFENLSAVEGQRSHDLNKRLLNQLVTENEYFPTPQLSSGFIDSHLMMEEIQILRRVAFRELIVRLEIMEKDPDYDGYYDEVSHDISLPLTIGLRDVAELNAMKMMGALCNPLFQNKKRMVASGLCTEEQYELGKSELLKRMCQYMRDHQLVGQLYFQRRVVLILEMNGLMERTQRSCLCPLSWKRLRKTLKDLRTVTALDFYQTCRKQNLLVPMMMMVTQETVHL